MEDIKNTSDYDFFAKINQYIVEHSASHSTEELIRFFNFLSPILDLGMGSGRHANYLKDEGFEVVGLDISWELLKKSQFNKVVCARGERLPFRDKVFKSVLCSEVLDHLLDPESCLEEVSRVLADGGFACFTLPCCNLPFKKIWVPLYRKLARIKPWPKEEYRHVFSSRELLKLLNAHFEIEEVFYKDFTSILKWRYGWGYALDRFFSRVCQKFPFFKFFAGSILIKVRPRYSY